MLIVYRKHIGELEWHFHTQCPRWPEADFVQLHYILVTIPERLCAECNRLQLEMFPPKD